MRSWHCQKLAQKKQSCQGTHVSFASFPASSNTSNPLFRVLFIFPSRYLFAIGLAHICSCRWDVLAAVRSNPKGRDSMKILCTTTRARHGDFNPLRTYDQKACMRTVAGHLSPKNKSRMVTTISMSNLPMLFAITCQRSQFGLWFSTYLYAGI